MPGIFNCLYKLDSQARAKNNRQKYIQVSRCTSRRCICKLNIFRCRKWIKMLLLLLLLTVSSQTTSSTFMLHYTAQRRRRQHVLVETSTFPLYWVKHEPSSTDISKYFYKRNNNKKDYYIELNLFFLCWLACFKFMRNKNTQIFRIGLTLFWQYTCQNICDSFFLNWTCFKVFFF